MKRLLHKRLIYMIFIYIICLLNIVGCKKDSGKVSINNAMRKKIIGTWTKYSDKYCLASDGKIFVENYYSDVILTYFDDGTGT